MIEENINKKPSKLRVLIAPLDWGLGHVTRCIPIIQGLLNQNAEVIIAAEEPALSLLTTEFPTLKILPLKGYKVRYSSHPFLFFHLLIQLPRLLNVISYERSWLKKMISAEKIDIVISDNRFGLYHPAIRCIYITHQLFIETGNNLLNRVAQKIHYRFINHFNEVWVPDAKGENNLAGKLSHPEKYPGIPVLYTGILSRFFFGSHEKKTALLVILSGPEPQRSIFENMLLEQLKEQYFPVILIRGLPGNKDEVAAGDNVKIYNHVVASQLNTLIQQSSLVLARCGYSTIMDLAVLKQKAILVPTPGQTEQEYLGKYLHEKKFFLIASQQSFSLPDILDKARDFNFSEMNVERFNENSLKEFMNSREPALQ